MPVKAGFGVVLLLAASRLGVADPQSAPDPNLCSIKGSVVNSVTKEGLRKAYVRLMGSGKNAAYPAITDDKGNFEINAVEPGTYSLFAEHQGFIDSELSEDSGAAVQIRLKAGQSEYGMTVRLTPQAVVSGRVVDEDGDPWVHGAVSLRRIAFKHGHREVEDGDYGQDLDDRGEFRLGAIPPGTYYVTAYPDVQWESRNTPRAAAAPSQRQITWYPSSLSRDGATAITVGPGEQMTGLEIRLRRGSVHRIHGTLVGLANVPALEGQSAWGKPAISASGYGGEAGTIHPDGSFDFRQIPPGTYDLQVHQGFPDTFDLGSTTVQVGDQDVENVSIQLTPPWPVKGAIQVEEPGSLNPSGLRVFLDILGYGSNPEANAKPDGSFELPRVGLGRYQVEVGRHSGNEFYLKQIRYGDTVSNDGTIALSGPAGPMVLVLSTRGAHLSGRVNRTADQKPEASSPPQVLLVPATGQARLADFDQSGTFIFDNPLPPGDYKLFAFEAVPDGAWEDPDFMKETAALATEIKLAEGEVRNADIPLLSRSQLAPVLKKLGME